MSVFGFASIVGQVFNLPMAQQIEKLPHKTAQYQELDRPWRNRPPAESDSAANSMQFTRSTADSTIYALLTAP
jgi:hypothetical protein